MKKYIALFVMLSCFYMSTIHVLAKDNVDVYLNSTNQNIKVSVYEIDGTVLVPIRPIFELFHYKIEWDNMRQRITTTTALGSMKIQIGSILVSKNDYQAHTLSTYPRILNGMSVIPIEFAAECTDSNIRYVESSNAVIINSK